MVEVLAGGFVAIASAAVGAWVADRLARRANAEAFELQRLAIFAQQRLESFSAFRDEALRFLNGRDDPSIRTQALGGAYSALNRITICDSSSALNRAVEIYALMTGEAELKQEVVIDGDPADEQGRLPVYRFRRSADDESQFTRKFLELDAQLVADIRSKFDLAPVRQADLTEFQEQPEVERPPPPIAPLGRPD